MKPYSFFVGVFLLVLISCKQEKSEVETGALIDTSRLSAEDINRDGEMVDSMVFHIGKYEFELEASSKEDFESVKESFVSVDTSEAKRINPYSSFVMRKGDTLLFKSNQSILTTVVNNPNQDSDEFSSYEFLKDMPEINQWLLKAFYYESYGFLFIDKTTGARIDLYGMPAVSPNFQYIVTFNQDLEAGFTFNGFQLFEIKDATLQLIESKELYSWGPDNVKWKDANTLLVERSKIIDKGEEQEIISDYVQLKMR